MSAFSSLASLLGLGAQPPAIVSEIVAERPAEAPALRPLAGPLDAARAAFVAAGGTDSPELLSYLAAAFGAAACPTLLARVIPVAGKGRQRRRRRDRLARSAGRALKAIAKRA